MQHHLSYLRMCHLSHLKSPFCYTRKHLQNSRRIHLCCRKSLSVWSIATAVTGRQSNGVIGWCDCFPDNAWDIVSPCLGSKQEYFGWKLLVFSKSHRVAYTVAWRLKYVCNVYLGAFHRAARSKQGVKFDPSYLFPFPVKGHQWSFLSGDCSKSQ